MNGVLSTWPCAGATGLRDRQAYRRRRWLRINEDIVEDRSYIRKGTTSDIATRGLTSDLQHSEATR
jgi:hypothetical protein